MAADDPTGVSRRAVLAGSAGAAAALSLASPAGAQRVGGAGKGPSSARAQLPDPSRIDASDPTALELVECVALLQSRRLSSSELTRACLARIEAVDGPIRAWARLYPESATQEAATADRRLSRAEVRRLRRRAPVLAGVPLGLKDLYAAAGRPLAASSRVLAGNVASGDSTVWDRLRRRGMVLLGHTHTHEFAAGNYTPQTGNPWDTARTPGGSSGGSGAALAARMVPAATGSDSLGSLRIPASMCGVTTIKPTFGLVSTHGVIPFAWSFDTAGPMARSAADVALLLSCMASDDPADPATLAADSRPALYPLRARRGARPLRGLRVGMPDQLFGGLTPEPGIAERYEAFAGEMRSLGAELVPFAAPRSPIDNLGTDAGFAFFLDVVGTEVDLYHRQFYPARAADYEPDVAAVLAAFRGRQSSAAAYLEGQRTRAELAARWSTAFDQARLDLVLQPAALVETPARDEAATRTREMGAPMFVWNYTGFPVVGVPAGRSGRSGMPVGVQLVGRPGAEAPLLQVAIDCQAHFPHQRMRP